jgi:excinuclease ABC subunit C
MNSNLVSKIKNLPDNPGVYQFLNEKGKVIYVGKARNLKNRVRSYFHDSITSAKTLALVNKINDFELILTDNEIEALVLENNLIKDLKPRYNINLKDDKSYPFIKVTHEPYPRVYPTRRIVKDGSRYFGPYTNVRDMKAALRMINQIFKIRSCKLNIDQESIDKKRFKVCLDYHIHKCDGPCEGLVSEKDYNDMVSEVVKLLKGKTDDLIKELTTKMETAVGKMEYEKAAEIRDKRDQLNIISERQKIVANDFGDRDVISIAYEGKDSACSIFNIRGGKLTAKKQLKLGIDDNDDIAEIYAAAIKFYYGEYVEVPKEILIEVEPADAETLASWLSQKAERTVKFVVPKKSSDSLSLINMCKQNAILQLKEIQIQKMKNQGNVPYALSALQRDLRLKVLPRKIECFDISNLQGTDSVASMVAFIDGKPKKSLYRKFIIKTVEGPDDFSSMREVIERRYKKLLEEKDQLPDLIMVDGGKGQLSSALSALKKLGVKEFNIIGLAKRLEEVFFPGHSEPESIPKTSSGLKLLQQVRDEAHRFAITFHRDRRSKRTITSELNGIKGIGKSTADKLLKEIGSISVIQNANIETIAKVVGKAKAELIKRHFETSDHP